MIDFLKNIPSKLRHNVGLKLISLLLAFVLWLLVVMYYNPETTNRFTDIPISLSYDKTELLSEHGLILVTAAEGSVDVEIEDTREKLKAISGKINAVVDISSVTKAGEYALPVKIVVDGQTINAVNQSVQTMSLMFEKATTTQFTVDVLTKGKVADGYVLEKVANPTVVTITGPDSVVSKIATVQAVVTQDKFTESGSYDATITYLDKDGQPLDDTYITLDTDAVKVNISVYEEKSVPLQIELTNSSGGNDSLYVKAVIEPASITIAGNSETLAEINSISLGTLDLAEINGNYNAEIALIIPNGVKNVDGYENAKVTLDLSGTITKQFTLDVSSVEVENIAKGNKIEQPTGQITLTVRGDAADIKKLTADDITLRIDCKNQKLSNGSNRMSVYCVFPEEYKVGAVGKYELTVKVS